MSDGGQEALPHDTLTDWATYGDVLVTVTVTDERRQPMTAEEQSRGEGFEARIVTLNIGQPTWERSGDRHDLPASLTAANGGWIINTEFGVKTERRLQLRGQTVADVGHQYLALLTYTDITAIIDPDTRKVTAGEGAAWTILDMLPMANGRPTLPEGRQTPALRAVTGRTAQEAGELLQATTPDPAAANYMTLDPTVRYQYTQLDRQHPRRSPGP